MLALRAPRALLRCSSSCRTRLAPTVGRSYCTGPRKPSGFGHFFPRTGSSSSSSSGASRVPKDAASKDASKAEKGADKMKAEGGSGGGGSSEGGGGGGGFKMPDNDQLVRIGLAAAGATVLTYAITGGEGGGGGRSAHQISMQHFLGNVLASGRVRKLVVVNSSVVRVYVSEDPLGREGFGDPGASGGGESGFISPPSGGGYSPSAEASRPAFYFSIGSVEQLEEKIDAAQAALGIRSRDFIPVQYVQETSAMSELGRRHAIRTLPLPLTPTRTPAANPNPNPCPSPQPEPLPLTPTRTPTLSPPPTPTVPQAASYRRCSSSASSTCSPAA